MTKTQATELATDLARQYNATFLVWRMPSWPVGVCGVLESSRGLPTGAELLETLSPLTSGLLF